VRNNNPSGVNRVIMKPLYIAFYLLIIVLLLANCGKTQIEPMNYFDATINNRTEQLKLTEAQVENGITEITVSDDTDNHTKTILITINSDKIGRFHQYYDYKTGVSMSECWLNYEIHEKDDLKNPNYFKSIEGQVELTDINSRKKTISGNYNFRINSLSEKNIPNFIKGKFINVSFKRN
jgi:hypothetical protein